MDTKKEVEEVIDRLRPALMADGGDIELVDVKDGLVKVRLMGACSGCPMAQMTLKGFVEDAIKKNVAGIKAVESV